MGEEAQRTGGSVAAGAGLGIELMGLKILTRRASVADDVGLAGGVTRLGIDGALDGGRGILRNGGRHEGLIGNDYYYQQDWQYYQDKESNQADASVERDFFFFGSALIADGNDCVGQKIVPSLTLKVGQHPQKTKASRKSRKKSGEKATTSTPKVNALAVRADDIETEQFFANSGLGTGGFLESKVKPDGDKLDGDDDGCTLTTGSQQYEHNKDIKGQQNQKIDHESGQTSGKRGVLDVDVVTGLEITGRMGGVWGRGNMISEDLVDVRLIPAVSSEAFFYLIGRRANLEGLVDIIAELFGDHKEIILFSASNEQLV